MQVISSGAIALAIALGVRGIRLRRPRWLLAAWAVAAWQVSLGFAIGLPFAYLLGLLLLIGAAAWLRRGRPALDRRLLVAGAAGAVLFAAVVGLIAQPYFRVADEHPEAKRPPSTVEAYSGPLAIFLTAPDENTVWGPVTEEVRDGLDNIPEKTLFPGGLILLLALVGLGSSSYPHGLRVGLGAGVVGVSILALGFQEDDGLLWPYRAVYEVLPGWEAIRTPGRLATFSSLGLALLAGAGADAAVRATRRWLAARSFDPGPRGASVALSALAVLLFVGVLVEGRGLPFDPRDDQDQPEVPAVPASTADVPAPQLHLPAPLAEDNRRYLLWSTDGFPLMVNGRSSLVPTFTGELIEAMRPFPDPYTARVLRRLGVRTVILHTDRVAGTPWAGAAAKPVAGLPLRRREGPGGLVIYEIRAAEGDAPTTIPESIGALRRSR
jgi:hypothetical protein